jgi:hypothetical protein
LVERAAAGKGGGVPLLKRLQQLAQASEKGNVGEWSEGASDTAQPQGGAVGHEAAGGLGPGPLSQMVQNHVGSVACAQGVVVEGAQGVVSSMACSVTNVLAWALHRDPVRTGPLESPGNTGQF